jgi:hypothetical protein
LAALVFIKRFHIPALKICLGMAFLQAFSCQAESLHPTAKPVDRQKLLELGQQFAITIGKDLYDAEAYLKSLDPEDLRRQAYFDNISDGETMVLQISLSKLAKKDDLPMRLDQPVNAIKQGHDVMVSLADFVSAASFPIHVAGESGKADGWFIRENKPFHLDLKTHKVTAGDKIFDIAANEALIQENDILIKGEALARWFGFKMVTNPQTQNLNIVASQEWPIQEKQDRVEREQGRVQVVPPQQPFRQDPYNLASPPNADINIRQSIAKSPNAPAQLNTTYSAQTIGDLAGFSAKSTITGNDKNYINDVHLGFSRSSENADLLGPMKARFYEFNDVDTVNVPFAGSSPQERGVHVTNKNPHITYDTLTEITGDATPGWDVELYRDQQYVDSMTVENDGRYNFTKVTLFAGDNKFRIVQYGPQGQIKEEVRTLSVKPASYARGGLYDVSLSQQDTQTYNINPSTEVDAGTPRLAGTYERQVTPTLALQSGIEALQENGSQHEYVHGGAVTVLDNTIINADAVGTSAGSFLGALTARRNFGMHGLTSTLQYKGQNYTADLPAPAVYSLSAEATGPLFGEAHKQAATYDVRTSLTQNSDGARNTQSNLNLSTRLDRLLINNNLSYQTQSQEGAALSDDDKKLQGVFSLRGHAYGMTWMTSADYDLIPDKSLKKYMLGLTRGFSPELQGNFTLTHELMPSYTSGQLAMNWNKEKFTLSPTISYDTNHALNMAMNLHFGLTKNPYAQDFEMSGNPLIDKGSVSAFVFLDKNGDGVFSKGDEPLEDATIESIQNQKTANTDKNGEAFLYDLPVSTITDIIVQESSAFEANWVPGFSGISIRPRPGHAARIEFPIYRGGEMEGTAYVNATGQPPRTARDLHLGLYDDDGKPIITVLTAPDGYYLFEKIPPGHYWLLADEDDSNADHALRPIPQEIRIGYEGTAITNNNLFSEHSDDLLANIPFRFSALHKPERIPGKPYISKPNNIVGTEMLLHLGPYHSRIALTFAWYKFKIRSLPWKNYFSLVTPLSKITPDPKTAEMDITLRPQQPLSLQEAAQACRSLQEMKFDCSVEVVTHYTFSEPPPTADAGDASQKKG